MFIFKFSFLPCFAHSVLIVSKIIVSMILFILFCSFRYLKASVRQLESEMKFGIYFDDLLCLSCLLLHLHLKEAFSLREIKQE